MNSIFGSLINQVVEAKPEPKRSNAKYLHTKSLNAKQTSNARERYKAALTKWTPTSTLEARLGCVATACNGFLRKLLAAGLIERRNKEGKEKYNRLEGYEWRWKE